LQRQQHQPSPLTCALAKPLTPILAPHPSLLLKLHDERLRVYAEAVAHIDDLLQLYYRVTRLFAVGTLLAPKLVVARNKHHLHGR
jgi:hypothetical protein